MRFFLRGVAEVAEEATATARAIIALREAHRALVQDSGRNAPRLLDLLFQSPIVNAGFVRDRLGVAFATASHLIERFQELGLVEETTGRERNRRYRYSPYLSLFSQLEEEPIAMVPLQTTEANA